MKFRCCVKNRAFSLTTVLFSTLVLLQLKLSLGGKIDFLLSNSKNINPAFLRKWKMSLLASPKLLRSPKCPWGFESLRKEAFVSVRKRTPQQTQKVDLKKAPIHPPLSCCLRCWWGSNCRLWDLFFFSPFWKIPSLCCPGWSTSWVLGPSATDSWIAGVTDMIHHAWPELPKKESLHFPLRDWRGTLVKYPILKISEMIPFK